MSKYNKLRDQNTVRRTHDEIKMNVATSGMNEMTSDVKKTISTYNGVTNILGDIDKRFLEYTKLDKTDLQFLMVATSLQVTRWVLLNKLDKVLDSKIKDSRIQHNDKSIIDMEKEEKFKYKMNHSQDKHVKSQHRDWTNIVFDGVPYDITRGCRKFEVNMEGGYHRIHTLGHDPVLGWIFGVMNIISDTITLDNWDSYKVEMIKRPKEWTEKTDLIYCFGNSLDSITEDINRLPAAIFAQGLHLKSDAFTKLGLPVPTLEVFNPDFAGKLYKEGYDSLCLVEDVAVVGFQASISIIINLIITLIRDLYYQEEVNGNKDLYDVKTRKILSLSNAIASYSNLIWVGGNIATGNELAIGDIDVGGLMVTAYRLVSDTKFINKVKKEFLENEWSNAVIGEEYHFISEVK